MELLYRKNICIAILRMESRPEDCTAQNKA